MRGQQVIVRAFGSKPLVRRVWEADEDTVFICSEQNYARLADGLAGLWPVAFSREDVFSYDPQAFAEAGGEERQSASAEWWDQFIVWQPVAGEGQEVGETA